MVKTIDLKIGQWYEVKTTHFEYIFKVLDKTVYGFSAQEVIYKVNMYYEKDLWFMKEEKYNIGIRDYVFYDCNNPRVKLVNSEVFEALYG